tara:strand:- start:1378 stop:1896 length:519 start_codon:yes stop_codon:yes gene_type:complete
MTTKNTFLIRAQVQLSNAGDTFNETEIDLGSYTNLGSSKPEVLRIHSAHYYFQDSNGAIPDLGGDKGAELVWQITTTSQTAVILANEDTFLMGGQAGLRNGDGSDNSPSQAFESFLMPQDYKAGQVVAVPSLFLGGFMGSEFTVDGFVTVILECTTEAMSKANAVALAISQQ